MEACERRFEELESSLKSFIESISERMIKTEDKLEIICNRMNSLESFNRENRGEFTEMKITSVSVDENVVSKQQKVKIILSNFFFKWEFFKYFID